MQYPPAALIIPALNEEASVGRVISSVPRDLIRWILVVDNGSSDHTAEVAKSAGATVISEPKRGYGNACLAGLSNLPEEAEAVVFMDADFSDYPEEMRSILSALYAENADLVIGSRVLGQREAGSLTPQQRIGNWIATLLVQTLYGFRYTDLGPFRAIRVNALKHLKMQDRNYGWTVEMQVKAVQQSFKIVEVPVSYRRRIGYSKVSGTVSGSLKAGIKILWTIAKLAWRNQTEQSCAVRKIV